jgi:hypothetical protein
MPQALRPKLKDPPHDGRLSLVNPTFDVRRLAIRTNHVDIVIAEHATTGDVAGLRLAHHRIGGALAGLRALEFGAEPGGSP